MYVLYSGCGFARRVTTVLEGFTELHPTGSIVEYRRAYVGYSHYVRKGQN